MQTLPQTPSSVWHCIKMYFKSIPSVLKQNWINYILLVTATLFAQLAVEQKNLIGAILYIILILLLWYLYAGFLYKANANLRNEAVNFREVCQIAWQRYWRLVGANLLFYLVLVVLIVVPILTISFLMSAYSKHMAWLYVPLGLFLFWVATTFIFIFPGIVLDNHKVIQAFKMSFNLVKGNWWRSFFVIYFSVGMVSLALGFLFGIILGIIHIITQVEFLPLVRGIFLLVTPVLFVSVILVQYNDLKLRFALKPNGVGQ